MDSKGSAFGGVPRGRAPWPSLTDGSIFRTLGIGLLPLLLLLAGCGFHPLYASIDGEPAPSLAAMDQIDVGLIPDRAGQIMREALENSLQRNSAPSFYRYHLNVLYGISPQIIGIQPDSSNSRVRYIATVTWTLTPEGNFSVPLATGNAETADAVNEVDNQLFALTLEGNQVQHALARELAEQVTEELAIYFRKHPSA